MTAANASSPISKPKRKRRTRDQMQALREAIYEICDEHRPLTVRNCYYRMVAGGIIEKTQREYDNVTVRLLGKMREAGELPLSWIIDNTRWMRKPTSFDSLEDCLQDTQDYYRRNLWQNQEHYVEVWCESDSAAGILYPATSKWDVPLMPCRGYASKTFLHEAALTIRGIGKPTKILYFGDYDPSGEEIGETVHNSLIRYGAKDIEFERCAVTPEQIARWDLPGKPPKKDDKKAKSFSGACVEIEAIPPGEVRELCLSNIEALISRRRLASLRSVEDAERDTLNRLIEGLGGAA